MYSVVQSDRGIHWQLQYVNTLLCLHKTVYIYISINLKYFCNTIGLWLTKLKVGLWLQCIKHGACQRFKITLFSREKSVRFLPWIINKTVLHGVSKHLKFCRLCSDLAAHRHYSMHSYGISLIRSSLIPLYCCIKHGGLCSDLINAVKYTHILHKKFPTGCVCRSGEQE